MLCLFTCLHNSPKANYKINASKYAIKQIYTHKQGQTKAAWTTGQIQKVNDDIDDDGDIDDYDNIIKVQTILITYYRLTFHSFISSSTALLIGPGLIFSFVFFFLHSR